MNQTGLSGTEVPRLDERILDRARQLTTQRFDHPPLAFVHSYGCQQNVSDGERMAGILSALGFGFTDTVACADLILFNTCAVRESAEDRVFGNVGALKSLKRSRPGLLIALGGCMTQRPEVVEKLRISYPYVDIVFGANAAHRLPELLCERLETGHRILCDDQPIAQVVEGIPARRAEGVKAWLPIMQGCNNFCSYCIVPFVRGREVSRAPQEILREAKELLAQGYREITLLGQNVNSYGKGLGEGITFPTLMRALDALDGEHRFRFMTSHPKDCTPELLDALSDSTHFCRHIHLPVQSGSNRVLAAMNRGYTVEQYRSLLDMAREKVPGVTFSSDIIVGFPGETRSEFEQTLELVKQVRYNALFTFIYSPRSGTKAADMADLIPTKEKSHWMRELLAIQQEICCESNAALIGRSLRVLADSKGKTGTEYLAGRTDGNIIVEFPGDANRIGRFCNVVMTKAMSWAMLGECCTQSE